MAVVPDPVPRLSEQLRSLQGWQRELLDHVIRVTRESARGEGSSSEKEREERGIGEEGVSTEKDAKEDKDVKIHDILRKVAKGLPKEQDQLLELTRKEVSDAQSLEERLQVAVARVVVNDEELESCKSKLREEIETMQRYRVEFSRRTHDYGPFITDFIKALARNGRLPSRFLKRPSNAQPVKSVAGQKRSTVKQQQQGNGQGGKCEPPRSHKKARTTLLVNGTEVG